jgi:hypothetical protein
MRVTSKATYSTFCAITKELTVCVAPTLSDAIAALHQVFFRDLCAKSGQCHHQTIAACFGNR